MRAIVYLTIVMGLSSIAHGDVIPITFPGAYETQPLGINDSGEVVGTYGGSLFSGSFLEENGTFTSISVPGAVGSTVVGGINNAGQIVGTYSPGNGNVLGFVDNGGVFSTIDVLGQAETALNGINDSGQIVGTVGFQGFVYSGGTVSDINFPGAVFTNPMGINDSGEIVGQYQDAMGNTHGFSYEGGVFTEIDIPGASLTEALGINNSGQILAEAFTESFVYGSPPVTVYTGSSFLDNDGVLSPVTFPGSPGVATGLNDNGDIVGSYVLGSSSLAVEITPTPEPSSKLFLAGACQLLVVLARRNAASRA